MLFCHRKDIPLFGLRQAMFRSVRRARKLLATPTPMGMTPAGFQMEIPVEERKDASIQDIREAYGVPLAATAAEEGAGPGALPFIKPEDMQYFGRLMEDTDEDQLSKDEANERRIMALLLKIKSGTPPQRKTAMRQITDKARSFGAGPLFNQILPLAHESDPRRSGTSLVGQGY